MDRRPNAVELNVGSVRGVDRTTTRRTSRQDDRGGGIPLVKQAEVVS
jgi:hypothetical protein